MVLFSCNIVCKNNKMFLFLSINKIYKKNSCWLVLYTSIVIDCYFVSHCKWITRNPWVTSLTWETFQSNIIAKVEQICWFKIKINIFPFDKEHGPPNKVCICLNMHKTIKQYSICIEFRNLAYKYVSFWLNYFKYALEYKVHAK